MLNYGLIRIILIGLLPAAVVALTMFVGRNIFVAMFVMHWTSMILAPLALIYFLHGKSEIQWYLEFIKQQQLLPDWRYCIPLLLLGVAIPVLGYMVDSCRTATWHFCVGQIDDNLAEYGFHDASKALIIACAVYFPIINPLIEELFWRVLMDREYSLSVGLSSTEYLEDESSHLVESGPYELSEVKSTKSDMIPFYIKLIFSSLYSSYHTMVVGVFLGSVQFGILAFFGIALLGLFFHYIFSVSDPKRGYFRAVSFHVGIDAGVIVALGDALGWYSIIPS